MHDVQASTSMTDFRSQVVTRQFRVHVFVDVEHVSVV